MKKLLVPLLIVLTLILAACGSITQPTVVTPTTGLPPGVQMTNVAWPTPTKAVPLPTSALPPPAPLPSLRVLSVLVSVIPDDISQVNCGSVVTFQYTATFYLNKGNAGTISFIYTTDGGHSSKPATLQTADGQGNIQFRYTLTLTLPQDHTMPRFSEVIVAQPNASNSNQASVAGMCVVTT